MLADAKARILSMIAHESAVTTLRWRIGLVLFLKKALVLLTTWTFTWGTAVLVLRLTMQVAPLLLLGGLAAVPPLLAVAALTVRRRLPAATAVRAVLDRAGGCGGLLMAGAEHDLGRWEERLPPAAALRVHWHGTRAWALFAAGLVFLLTALLFPERLATFGASRPLEIGNEVAKLAAHIDLLKEAGALEPERAEALKEKLGKLKQDSSGENPAKTLEALDHLQNLVNKAAREAGEGAVQKTENLAKTEALAEGLRQAAGDISPKVEAEAMAELAALVQKAAAENSALAKSLDAKTAKDLKAGRLSARQMKMLARALRGSRQDLGKMLEKLSEARLIDPELLKACEKAGMCDGKCLADLLKGDGKMGVKEMVGKCQGPGKDKLKSGRPGRGGTTEGPAASELTWGEKTSEEGVKFKEEALPPAAVKALKDSRLAGLGKQSPPEEKAGGPSLPGALGQAAAGGGSANTQILLPEHRATVGRYFERPARKSARTSNE
jgi:hypothetical protein